MFTKFDKALAAIISGFLTQVFFHLTNIELGPGVNETVTTLIVALFVWLFPNKQPKA